MMCSILSLESSLPYPNTGLLRGRPSSFPCVPAGVILCFKELHDEYVFAIIYVFVASYFPGVMVQLMLILTPIVCMSAMVALSSALDTNTDPTQPDLL